MTYFNKNAELKNGYNTYIDTAVDDMGTQIILYRELGIEPELLWQIAKDIPVPLPQ